MNTGKMMRIAREHGMDLDDNPVAYEFYNPATGHAIVDYTRWTHAGHLREEDGYIARPLVYAADCPDCKGTGTFSEPGEPGYPCSTCNETSAEIQAMTVPQDLTDERAAFEACGSAYTEWVEAKGRYAWDLTEERWTAWRESALAGAAAAQVSADKLHRDIMNLPWNEAPFGCAQVAQNHGYALGHRDARHAAAELVSAALRAAIKEKQ